MSQLTEIVKDNMLPGLILLDVTEDFRGNFIRIIVDGEHQVTLEETTKLSKILRDQEGFESKFPNGFRLEVTTPGLERPLEHEFQYKKNIDRKLKLTIQDGDVTETMTATLKSVNAALIQVEESGDIRDIPFSDIVKATVKISFN